MGSYDGVVRVCCSPCHYYSRTRELQPKRTGLQDAVRGTSSAIRRRGRCDGEATYRCGCHVTRGTDGARGHELALILLVPYQEQNAVVRGATVVEASRAVK